MSYIKKTSQKQKNNQYEILKIKISSIINADFDLYLEQEEEEKYIVKQQDTPLFRQLTQVRGFEKVKVDEIILVEAKHNKEREHHLRRILNDGFSYNGKRYRRFGKSASQAKDGITVFASEDVLDELFERSQLGLSVDKCVISKYESYRNLILSSCDLIDEKLPYIVIVDEHEKMIENQYVRYGVHKDINYTDKNTGEPITLKNQRKIEEGRSDIEVSPFDGFGVQTKEVTDMINTHLDNNHDSVLFQIRLPFMKGVSVQFPFKEFYKERGVEQITDVFGKVHNVDDIDCIWNTSMWKGYKYFKEAFGDEGWNEYINRLKKYNYYLFISKFSHHMDDIGYYSRLNFQYLQCLDLMNSNYIQKFKEKDMSYDILDSNNDGRMVELARYSTNLLEKIIKGDKLYTLKFLGIHDTKKDDVYNKYSEAILINKFMLKDPSIKKMLKRKLDKTIEQMKYGKIYGKGFYHTVVGDIIGYLEYAGGLDVVGCLNGGEFYANTLDNGECLSMRSPLVDPSEVNKVNLVDNQYTKKYFNHFKNQDICMINMYDLTMQQQGGMDEDGDTVFLSNDPLLVDTKIEKPIVVDLDDKVSTEPVEYNTKNITEYECNSRDNRIGEITNIATSILNQYTENEKWQKVNEENVALLRLYQGKEIDFVKTGFRWVITRNLRNYLKKIPYFLLYNYPQKLKVYNNIKEKNKQRTEKKPLNAYSSPSAMNELCHYISEWEKRNILWDKEMINNGHLMIDNDLELKDNKIIKDMKRINNQFKKDLKNAIKKDADKDKVFDRYEEILDDLDLDDYLKANYFIKMSYRSLHSDKTLCWYLYGETMLENLRNNSDEREREAIIETDSEDSEGHEFLGRYYKLQKRFL